MKFCLKPSEATTVMQGAYQLLASPHWNSRHNAKRLWKPKNILYHPTLQPHL